MANNILIVEDSEIARVQIIEALKAVGLFDNYIEAHDGRVGLHILATTPVDFIICDLMMPNIDGLEFLEEVKRKKTLQGIPVIMLSSCEKSSVKVKALQAGASDYVSKPFDPGELVARIRVHLNIKALQDHMRQVNELLKELSITDHLTHLYNRRYI